MRCDKENKKIFLGENKVEKLIQLLLYGAGS